ncbi:sulfatase-like hydrolase/transferase [Candidatus Skiveiella danica]|uniref:sulfatase-like hydrolase/transferase n=1 Tax=Candidatus Skiveiella danica TaxID=3386177 RepID=UPI001E0790FB|nr:sulfatase-like hydrolase/transferase [Betaproteobacteria bacterium]
MLFVATLQLAGCSGSSTGTVPERPNILFVIMDDVGIDQMPAFGYGGATPPNMPNIDTVAQAGLRFGNTWSMPECSPVRGDVRRALFAAHNIYQASAKTTWPTPGSRPAT